VVKPWIFYFITSILILENLCGITAEIVNTYYDANANKVTKLQLEFFLVFLFKKRRSFHIIVSEKGCSCDCLQTKRKEDVTDILHEESFR